MTRFSKYAVPFCAVLIAVVVGGCGKAGGSPTPSPISDPSTLITQSGLAVTSVQTIHFEMTLDGSIKTAALGSSAAGLGGSIKLNGATISGDLDIAHQAYHLNMSMPSLMGLTADVIQVDGSQYTKVSLQSDKYTKSKGADFGAVASAAPVASADVAKTITQIKSALDSAGVTATISGTEKVDGRDAYRLSVSMPVAKINSLLEAAVGSAASGITIDSASLDYWVYKDTLQPAKMELSGTSAAVGNIDLVLTLTKYNEKVTIVAPSADQIQTAQ